MSKRLYPVAALALVLLIAALVGYVLPGKSEDLPTRVLFDNIGGKIVFDHQVHAEEYGINCRTCHHTDRNPEVRVVLCGACHIADSASTYRPNRMEAFHQQCMGCHEAEGKGPYLPEDCNLCHFK